MTFLHLLPVLSGCSSIDAPDNLESLVVFGFVHVTDDEAYGRTFDEGVRPLLDEHAEALDVGMKVDALSAEDLSAAGIEDPDEQSIIGVSAANHYRADVLGLAEVLTRPDLQNVYEMTVGYDVLNESDRGCFLDQTCELYTQEAVRINELGFFGTSSQTFTKHFRWIETEEGEQVLLLRTLSPEPVDVSRDIFKIHQQYDFSLFTPHDGGTRRLENFWVDADVIGMDVPDTFALDQAVKAMKNTRDELDEIVMGPLPEDED